MTKIKVVDADNPSIQTLEEATSLILKGEVLVCPTDTGYALTANALDIEAVQKVFAIKKRPFNNPIHIAVSGIEEAERYAYVDEIARFLASRFLPGALTLVLPRREIVPPLLVGNRDTIGIRIPDNQTMLRLIHMTGLPLTATSANISGRATPYTAQEVIEQLGKSIQKVALIIDQGSLAQRGTSTIVDLSIKPPRIIRQSRLSEREILKALHSSSH
jgi:L-threonylcarbamoyladenylate synthase